MQIGFLSTKQGYDFLPVLSKMLTRKGHELSCVLHIDPSANFAEALNYAAMQCGALIYHGDKSKLFDALKNDYEVDPSRTTFELNDTLYAVMEEFSEDFVTDSIVPMLNSRCKTLYTTAVFKTFGKSEDELRERLKSYIKNKNRIAFTFYPADCECEVDVRYSSKMSHETVDGVLAGVASALEDVTYATSDISLAKQVFRLLKAQGKKLCVAESFTGGRIASEITLCEGASEVFTESIVCYGNESKTGRLGVSEATIAEYGAVSPNTVYEMAVNVLSKSGCDLCLATSGNAGPTAEKEGENGLCFIAVGDMNGIHIYKYNFVGDRKKVTESGVNYALYHLYKKLRSSRTESISAATRNNE